MAWQRPTLAGLIDRIQNDIVTRLQMQTALLRRSVLSALARADAGATHELHGHLAFLALQLFPDTAEKEFLERQGSLVGITRLPASYAAGPVILVGTNGTLVPAATVLQRADGAQYDTDADATIATLAAWAPGAVYAKGVLRVNGGNVYVCTVAGTSAGAGGPAGTGTAIADNTCTWRYVAAGAAAVAVNVTALVAGVAGNSDIGVTVTFVAPIAGANAAATVSVGSLSNGADQESDDALRTRLMTRLQQPPQGGSTADYLGWALANAGVTRAWVYPLELGSASVTVRFVRDNDGSGVSIIPDAGEVAAVQAYIDARRPVTAAVTVVAPVSVAQAFTIHIVPDTAATRAAVQAELEDLLKRDGKPGGTLLRSQMLAAIAAAADVTDFALTLPAADVAYATGEIPTLGAITWT